MAAAGNHPSILASRELFLLSIWHGHVGYSCPTQEGMTNQFCGSACARDGGMRVGVKRSKKGCFLGILKNFYLKFKFNWVVSYLLKSGSPILGAPHYVSEHPFCPQQLKYSPWVICQMSVFLRGDTHCYSAIGFGSAHLSTLALLPHRQFSRLSDCIPS